MSAVRVMATVSETQSSTASPALGSSGKTTAASPIETPTTTTFSDR